MLLKRREVAFHLRDSGAKLLFAWDGFAQEAQPGAQEAQAECILVAPGKFEQSLAAAEPRFEVVDAEPDGTAVILYTSGTTWMPKGAELTHRSLMRNCEIMRELFDLGPDAVTLAALPLFHSFGQTSALNAAIAGGGTLTLIPRLSQARRSRSSSATA